MSYYLRGEGLGATVNLPAQPAYKPVVEGAPGPGECFINDSACVAGNAKLNDAYQVALAGAMAQFNLDTCHENANLQGPGAQHDAALAACGAAYSDAAVY